MYDNLNRLVALATSLDNEVSVLRHSIEPSSVPAHKVIAIKDSVNAISMDCHQLLRDLEELIDVQKD